MKKLNSKQSYRSLILMVLLLVSFNGLWGQVTLIIDKLPNTTPVDDSIFVCGTFNNWNVNDTEFQLHKLLNGRYAITLPDSIKTFEYKFSRGTWLKIETNKDNEYLPNRIHQLSDNPVVHITINNWQDLGGAKKFNYFSFINFTMAIYGLALLFILWRIKKRHNIRFKAFFTLNLLITITLLGSVLYTQLSTIWQSYLSIAGDLLFFSWGIILYLFLLMNQQNNFKKRFLWHFVILLLVIMFGILRLVNFSALNSLTTEFNSYLSYSNIIILIAGWLVNFIYHAKSYSILTHPLSGTAPTQKHLKLLNLIFINSSLALLVMALNGFFLWIKPHWGLFHNFNLVLIALSIIVFIQIYYFWRYPEILQKRPSFIDEKIAAPLLVKLRELMEQTKIYKSSELTLAELSGELGIKPHLLSKLLNEKFSKNFRDFINEYRVREFIFLYQQPKYKNYTFLALAHEVGFNSKSTFNLAFKKATRFSPREYFRHK